MPEHFDVIVIGAGPAGLMAACRAAERGRKTLLLEKNRRAGLKILLSGGNRCNLTHATDARGIAAAFAPQGRFLLSALAALGPEAVVELFAAEGVPTKVEPDTGKIFPQSDRATDVLAALLARLTRTACTLALDEPVLELRRCDQVTLSPCGRGENSAKGQFNVVTKRRTLTAEAVVLTTGGLSYPASGSTGDGYAWAAALGHTIVRPRPALVPITTHAPWVLALQGITLPDIVLRVIVDAAGGKPRVLDQRRGALLFAHFGVTGPVVLDVSRSVSGWEKGDRHHLCEAPSGPFRQMVPVPFFSPVLRCDLLPDVKQAHLESLLQQECAAAGKRMANGILSAWLPQRVAETIARLAAVDDARRAAELTRHQRQALARGAKEFDIPVAGTMGFRKAEVTAGGVALDEVDSHDMQSKLVPGLYFAGEVLDLDGRLGGYNFQGAFSTGWLAGDYA